MPRKLRKPLTRRIGDMVVRLDADGISIRGFGKRTWRRATWLEIAFLCKTEGDQREYCESEGLEFLNSIGARPSEVTSATKVEATAGGKGP